MKIAPVTKQHFGAIPLSEIKINNSDSNYKLYEITPNDEKFLDNLSDNLDLGKLMPKMSYEEIFVWKDLINSAIRKSKNYSTKTILETYNDVPCGILNYSDNKHFKVNYVATFPDKKNHRVPYAGQILFNELFKRFIDGMHTRIELEALRIGPFSPISTYLKLGFGMCGGNSLLEKMVASREKVLTTLAKQDQFIISNVIKNKEEVDLGKITHTDHFLAIDSVV